MAKNNKDTLILNAVLAYPTVREASEAINVPESTIYLRLKDEQFNKRYNEAKGQMLKDTTTFLQVKLKEATATIIEIMNDVETPPQVRLNAAKSIFDYAIRLTETTEILSRIEALEANSADSCQ